MNTSKRDGAATNEAGMTAPSTLAQRPPLIPSALFAALVLTGVVLRVGLLSPDNLLGLPLHNHVFNLHAVLTLAAMPLVLLALTPSRAEQAGLRRAIAGCYVLGAALVGAAAREQPANKVAYVAGGVVMLAALALYAGRLLGPVLRSAQGGVLALASAGLALGWLGPMIHAPDLSALMLFPLVLSALLTPLIALRERGAPVMGPGAWIAAGAYLLSRTIVRYSTGASPLALVEWLAALILAAAALRAAVHEDTSWQRWLLRLQALLFAGGVSVTVLAQIATDHTLVDKTLVALGAMHLEALVLLFALLREWVPEPRNAWGVRGLALAAVGAHVFGYGCVQLGRHGMPRRYGAYLEVFATGQVVTSLGALALLAGLVVIAYGVRERRPNAGASP